MRVGLLALQGDFAKHAQMLTSLGAEVIEVKKPEDLLTCEGLIIPGGESTTMFRQIEFVGLREPLLQFAKEKPIYGTCAGLILMSSSIQLSPFKPLQLLDIEVERNAYGRQVESFESTIQINLSDKPTPFPAFFIRAPRIHTCSEKVKILAEFNGKPVFVQQGHHLGSAFHPELTSNPLIHKHFLEIIEKNKYTKTNSG